MTTLLLQCVAPLQAWGTQSHFTVRDTGREPSKSGIVGLLCAALGRPREDTDTVAQLAALRMGVRVDREGKILRDYHTAGMGGYLSADGKTVVRRSLIPSSRYYLTDAAFLVGLEGEETFLGQLHEALRNPRWLLFLGRKACVPSRPIYIPAKEWYWDADIQTLFAAYRWLGTDKDEHKRLESVRVVMDVLDEDEFDGNDVRNDHPISFIKGNRRFTPRRIRTTFIDKPPFRDEGSSSDISVAPSPPHPLTPSGG